MYSRSNPSERYKELIKQYKQLHTEGEKNLGLPPDQTFPGLSIVPHVNRIRSIIQKTRADTILDYGSGKGFQYSIPVVAMPDGEKILIVDYWDVMGVTCYDPCYEEHSALPEGKFDGVVSTDMLEHCSEEDVPWILREIFSFSSSFVYLNVACYPANKSLPNGENAHCTIQPIEWWKAAIEAASTDYPGILWEAVFAVKKTDERTGENTLVERTLSG